MDLQPISMNSAIVILTAEEAAELGISFDSFEKENPETKSFLTCTLAVLQETGLFDASAESVSVEVYEQNDAGLVVYISSVKKAKTNISPVLIGFLSESPLFFFKNAPEIYEALNDKIISSELYKINNNYALIISVNCTKATAQKKLSKVPPNINNPIKAAKIREYGKLLSDSPFSLFT